MMRREFIATQGRTTIGGWVAGHGTHVLALHGGPGLGYEYLDALADDLGPGYQVASYQQRGLPPSMVGGPFDIAAHVSDLLLVLDELGWDRAVVVGHSWGAHLALHAAVAVPDRISGLLLVDQMGAVGDARLPEFAAELKARLPPEAAARMDIYDELGQERGLTDAEAADALALLWPSYFSVVEAAPPVPAFRLSQSASDATMASALAELPRLGEALSSIVVPVGFVAGGASPMPTTASTDAAERIDGAWVETLADVGHFPWLEAPGSTRRALDRLVRAVETRS